MNNADWFRVEIRRRGFVGTPVELVVPGESTLKARYNPVEIRYSGQDEGLNMTIWPSEANAFLISILDQEFIEFLDAKQDEYLVVVYISENHTPGDGFTVSEIEWMGFIVPQDYQESYLAPPYDSQVSCTDQLGLLNDIVYDGPLERMTLLKLVGLCLQKTGLPVDIIYISIDLFEVGHALADNREALSQTYFDTNDFKDEDGEITLTYFEILEDILKNFKARLFQAGFNGPAWWIQRLPEWYFPQVPVVKARTDGTFADSLKMDPEDQFIEITCLSDALV